MNTREHSPTNSTPKKSPLDTFLRSLHGTSGKVTLYAVLAGGLLFVSLFLFSSLEISVPRVNADDVSTSVTILNTPPNWTVDAQELVESSVTKPTNAGTAISWTALATDSNNDNYYLLICKTNAAPTAHSSAVPTCGGGNGNQWAVSGSIASGASSTAATTTTEAFAESNVWFAWVCDGNTSLPLCNAVAKQGSGLTASPFIVNHPPIFYSITNTSPQIPGANITWTAGAYDNDIVTGGGSSTVRIVVCKTAGFSNGSCTGATWATSTLVLSNPSTSTPIVIPTQDNTYNAFVYAVDNFNLAATSTFQATNSTFVVSNVAPTVVAATVSLVDPIHGGNLQLATPAGTSGPFQVQFQANDNNSCINALGGNEIASATVNVYRSGVGSTTCQIAGDYNSNNCYPAASPNFTDLKCTQDAASCSGSSSVSSTWTCTFSLWYNADPTDVGSQFSAQNWLATVRVTDDNGATSSLTEATTGNKLTSFLAFAVPPPLSIYYGGLQPGQQTDPLATTTTIKGQGNVGIDQKVYGDTMCTTWSAADSCDVGGANAGTKIPITNQKVATSSVAFASTTAFALSGSTTPITVSIHVPKTTVTSSPATKTDFWGINIPSAITLAGSYKGQNTITAITSSSTFW